MGFVSSRACALLSSTEPGPPTLDFIEIYNNARASHPGSHRAPKQGPDHPPWISWECTARLGPPNVLIIFQEQWHAWTGHTVFGASAGALNSIAENYGYVVVHIMRALDIFRRARATHIFCSI